MPIRASVSAPPELAPLYVCASRAEADASRNDGGTPLYSHEPASTSLAARALTTLDARDPAQDRPPAGSGSLNRYLSERGFFGPSQSACFIHLVFFRAFSTLHHRLPNFSVVQCALDADRDVERLPSERSSVLALTIGTSNHRACIRRGCRGQSGARHRCWRGRSQWRPSGGGRCRPAPPPRARSCAKTRAWDSASPPGGRWRCRSPQGIRACS